VGLILDAEESQRVIRPGQAPLMDQDRCETPLKSESSSRIASPAAHKPYGATLSARIGQPGGLRTTRDLHEWTAGEEPFLADQRPWERADLIVADTPQIPSDPLTELVVAQPPSGTKISRSTRGRGKSSAITGFLSYLGKCACPPVRGYFRS
jgi:hypothetical protein